jgi:hypothetical protein
MAHNIYGRGDGHPEGLPDCYIDENGDSYLDICKDCGKAESELEGDCLENKHMQKLLKELNTGESLTITKHEDRVQIRFSYKDCNGSTFLTRSELDKALHLEDSIMAAITAFRQGASLKGMQRRLPLSDDVEYHEDPNVAATARCARCGTANEIAWLYCRDGTYEVDCEVCHTVIIGGV